MNAVKITNAIKVDTEPELFPNISIHILLHTACTLIAEKGIAQRTLQEIMGRQNLAVIMKIYNYVDEKRVRDEMDKLDAVRNVQFLYRITEKIQKHMRTYIFSNFF